MSKITIFGGDYVYGMDVLGSTPRPRLGKSPVQARGKRAAFVAKTTPRGRKYTALVPIGGGKHKDSVKNARDVAARAIKVGNRLAERLKQTHVLGDEEDVTFGAAKDKGLTHVQLLQLKKLAKKTVEAGKKLNGHADKHVALVVSNQKRLASGAKSLSQQLTAATRIHGDDVTIGEDDDLLFGEAAEWEATCDVLGEEAVNEQYADIVIAAADAMADGVSVAPDGTADPSAATDGSADPSAAATGTGGPPDYGIGPAPTKAVMAENVDYVKDPGPAGDSNPYSSDPTMWGGVPVPQDAQPKAAGATPVPLGAVYYDGSHGPGSVGTFGSYGRCSRTYGDNGTNNDLGYLRGDGQKWDARNLHPGIFSGGDSHGDDQDGVDITIGPYGTAVAAVAYDSLRQGAGPLMTSQHGNWADYLRYDTAKDSWFWYYDKAPKWATQPLEQQKLNQAILDYQALVTAAAADYATQQAADKLDKANADALVKQNAKDDSATQRQYDQEQKQAEHQSALDAMQQQKDQAAANAAEELEEKRQAAAAEIENKRMQTQGDIDQRAAEAAAAYQAPGGGGYEDDQGEYADEGAPEPDDGVVDTAPDGGLEDDEEFMGLPSQANRHAQEHAAKQALDGPSSHADQHVKDNAAAHEDHGDARARRRRRRRHRHGA